MAFSWLLTPRVKGMSERLLSSVSSCHVTALHKHVMQFTVSPKQQRPHYEAHVQPRGSARNRGMISQATICSVLPLSEGHEIGGVEKVQ